MPVWPRAEVIRGLESGCPERHLIGRTVRRGSSAVVCAAVSTCVAAVFAVDDADRFRPTLHSLRGVADCPIVVGSPDPAVLDALSDVADKTVEAATAAELVNGLGTGGDDIFMVSEPVVLP